MGRKPGVMDPDLEDKLLAAREGKTAFSSEDFSGDLLRALAFDVDTVIS